MSERSMRFSEVEPGGFFKVGRVRWVKCMPVLEGGKVLYNARCLDTRGNESPFGVFAAQAMVRHNPNGRLIDWARLNDEYRASQT